jgi:hypothetical protein
MAGRSIVSNALRREPSSFLKGRLLSSMSSSRMQAQPEAAQFALAQGRLSERMAQMVTARDQDLADPQLHPAARKVLKSPKKH